MFKGREYSKGGANDDTQKELSNFNNCCEKIPDVYVSKALYNEQGQC